MSSIMELIGPELSALELKKLPYLTLFTLGQNVCDRKILYEFDYGFNLTRTLSYSPLNLQKLQNLTLKDSINVDQLVPNIVTIYMTMRSWMSSFMGQIQQ